MFRIHKFLNNKALILIFVWVVFLSVLYSVLSLQRHSTYQSGGFDLGIFDQSVWQYSHLFFPYNTIKDQFIFGDHFNATLPLLAPLYWIWSDVRMLLIFQAVWIAFSTIAIYLLSRNRKFNQLISLTVGFLYSTFYGIQFAVFSDFHPVIFGVGLLAWLVYFLESKKKKLFILFLILVLLTQENMGIAVVGIGAIYFFRKEYRKVALAFIFLGIFASLVESRLIILANPGGFQYMPIISHNPFEIVRDLFNSQEKRQVWLYSYGWFSFLPLFSPGSIVAVIIDLAQYFVTGPNFSRMWSPFMHHRAILAVFLTLGTLDVLSFLKKKKINMTAVCVILILSAFFQQYHYHFALNKLAKKSFWQNESWSSDNKKILSEIPLDASVAAQQSLVPHLSQRKEIFIVYPRQSERCNKELCWWLDFAGKPTYLVVDVHPSVWLTQLLETREHFNAALQNMQDERKIILVKEYNDAKLYKINYK